MSTLSTRFNEQKCCVFSNEQTRAGFFRIIRLLKPSIYLKIGWEIITTVIIYSPSVSSYMKDVISSIVNKWDTLSETDKSNVIAALVRLNKHGKVEKCLLAME